MRILYYRYVTYFILTAAIQSFNGNMFMADIQVTTEESKVSILTDEVEIALSTKTMRDQPDHLVKSQATTDDWGHFRYDGHVRVHLLVHEPEGQGLISN